MKKTFALFFCLSSICAGINANADTWYVSLDSPNDGPGTAWSNAFHTIQQGVDAAGGATGYGHTVLVSNGTYVLPEEVAVTNDIVLRSVNGAVATIVDGQGACRGFNLGVAFCTLGGFTITNCYADFGGGVYCESDMPVISNCTFTCNSAGFGGGSYYGTLNNCVFSGNSAVYGGGSHYGVLNNCVFYGNSSVADGGGSYQGTLNNCTITGNWAGECGGGNSEGTLNNCIVYYNSSFFPCYNIFNSILNYSCCPDIDHGVMGNITNAPLLLSTSHIVPSSPCVGTGMYTYSSGTDIDGETWYYPPSMGCDEYHGMGTVTGPLDVNISVIYTNIAVGYELEFSAGITGALNSNKWSFGDGTVLGNAFYGVGHAWETPGSYDVVLTAYNDSYPNGVSATQRIDVVAVPVVCVSADTGDDSNDGSSWTEAKQTIQAGVDVQTVPGCMVLVTNGTYLLDSEIEVNLPMTVGSVNGPDATIVDGQGACRGFNLGSIVCVIDGFTVTNGYADFNGGGVCCDNETPVITNCTLVGNLASGNGGASCYGTLVNCRITGNSASAGGGSYYSMLNNCNITGNSALITGGGSSESTLYSCVISGNSAIYGGGGNYSGTLNNCMISGNSADTGGGSMGGLLNNCVISGNMANYGGGIYDGTFNNCTLSGNSASGSGGGSYYGTLNNCIIYHNTASGSGNDSYNSTLYFCCCPDAVSGVNGNITWDPYLLSSSHIASYSPCIGAGSYGYVSGTDVDGQMWWNPPAMGCDQFYGSESITGALEVVLSASEATVYAGVEVDFSADITGMLNANSWSFGDDTSASNAFYQASHSWILPGSYDVIFTAYNIDYPDGVSATQRIEVLEAVLHVSADTGDDANDGWSWATAKQTIQAGVDAQVTPGGLVLVTNGIYQTGTRPTPGHFSLNRVVIEQDVTVQSVNGPDYTFIVGAADPDTGGYGTNAVRGVYMADGFLAGFSVTNGFTDEYHDVNYDRQGGGVNMYGGSGSISNCTLIGNSARDGGGGSVGGTVFNCLLINNSSAFSSGGSYEGTLNNCTLNGNSGVTGGSYKGTLNNCLLSDNIASGIGGGCRESTLNNCTISGNISGVAGGGSFGSVLYNCLLVGNSSGTGGGSHSDTLDNCTVYGNSASDKGGGCYYGIIKNCIVRDNTASSSGDNWYDPDPSITYTCTSPEVAGTGNISDDPLFIDANTGNYHLRQNSPCVDKGDNSIVEPGDVDLDGRDRIINSTVDMGAYEYPVPEFGMTNTDASVYGEVETYSLGGSVNEWMVGTLMWSNTASGAHGTLSPTGTWTVDDIPIEFGSNIITISGSNVYDEVHSLSVTITRLYEHGGFSPIHYVAIDGTAVWPYTNWIQAATSIQDAINAASAGNQVQVGEGIYTPGAEIALTNDLMLVGVGESGSVIVDGQDAHRCFTISGESVINGFVIRNGGGVAEGGGVLFDIGGMLINCKVENCSAESSGGGVCFVVDGMLLNCVVASCSATNKGGGVYCYMGGSLRNGVITGCSASNGGGIYCEDGGVLEQLTISGNTATYVGGAFFDGGGTAQNSIIYFNSADSEYNNVFDTGHMPLSECCTPDVTGAGNVSGDPRFVDAVNGDFRLRHDSPCIDAGTAIGSVTNDLAGNPRPIDGNLDSTAAFDMGAYEYQGAAADTDGDGRTDSYELDAGFSPYYDEAPAISQGWTQGEANVTNNPSSYELYTPVSIMDLNMGYMMLQTSNGLLRLNLQLEKCPDLVEGEWTNAGESILWELEAPEGKMFFRVRGRE